MAKRLFLFAMMVFLLFSVIAAAQIDEYVVDQTGVFSEKVKAQAITYLKTLEQDTSVQLVIYVTPTIPPEFSLEEYTLHLAETNGIGQEGNDKGVLFFLATEDGQHHWEVSSGLEDVLTAPLLGRITRLYMEPSFKTGNYAQGILDGVEVVSRVLRNSTDPDIQTLKTPLAPRPIPKAELVFLMFIMFLFIIPLLLKNKKEHLPSHSSIDDQADGKLPIPRKPKTQKKKAKKVPQKKR